MIDEAILALDYLPFQQLPNGLFLYLRRDQIGAEKELPKEIVVAGHCTVTDEFYAVDVPIAGLSAWVDDGTPIQNALSDLSPADREWVKSRIRPGALGTGF